jgi:hypothetical protein
MAAATELQALLRDDAASSLKKDSDLYSAVMLALAAREESEGSLARAKQIAGEAVKGLRSQASPMTADARRTMAALLYYAGEHDEAARICDELMASGARHPELAALKNKLMLDGPN